jgi:hypothetical protein
MAAANSRSEMLQLAARAATAPRADLETFFRESARQVVEALAGNPNLREEDLLRLLERKDLPAEVLTRIARRPEVAKSYAVHLALVRHPHTPRQLSVPLIKFLFLFDLVRVSQTPAVSTDIKTVAEDTIIKKLETIPRGECITLARRATGRVAARLLLSNDSEISGAALDNSFLSEAHLVKVISHPKVPPAVILKIAMHPKWSHRYDVRLALIRHPLTPFAQVLTFLPDIALADLWDICQDRRLPEPVRNYLQAHCKARAKSRAKENPAPNS